MPQPWSDYSVPAMHDARLTWKARGLLAYLLACPEQDIPSVPTMLRASPNDGITALRATLKELMAAGYLGLVVARNATSTHARGRRYVLLSPPETQRGALSEPTAPALPAPEECLEHATGAGYVYIVQCETLYKIGCTRYPRGRLKVLSVKSPFPMMLRLLIPAEDMTTTEEALHHHFALQRVRGEWFRLTLADLDYIADAYPLVDVSRLSVD
jgi:hypothetical protein